jgi:hypothetical protein
MILYLVETPSLFDRRGTVLHAGGRGLAGQPPALRTVVAGSGRISRPEAGARVGGNYDRNQVAGLHGLIGARAAKGQLSGIVNGNDESRDLGTDPHRPHHSDPDDRNGK